MSKQVNYEGEWTVGPCLILLGPLFLVDNEKSGQN